MERVARIELANNPWQGFRLPLHHTRDVLFNTVYGSEGEIRTHDFTGLQSVAFDHSATSP